MKNELINHFTWLTNKLSEVNTFNSWSNDFKMQEIKESYETFYNSIKKQINLETLTVEEARELRFSKWDEESDLWLFPLWMVPLIPVGMEVTSISGKTFKYTKDTDNDIRSGCVAFGINIKED